MSPKVRPLMRHGSFKCGEIPAPTAYASALVRCKPRTPVCADSRSNHDSRLLRVTQASEASFMQCGVPAKGRVYSQMLSAHVMSYLRYIRASAFMCAAFVTVRRPSRIH